MGQLLKISASFLLSYIVGSIPTAYIYGKVSKGIDIRDHGSGNVGATNCFRVLGRIPGAIVLVIDILKGVAATTVIPKVFYIDHVILIILLGLTAVIGHNWTIFLQFKGGKGIATSLGVLIGLTLQIPSIQPVLLGSLAVWAGIFLFTGYVSLGSIAAAVVLPVLMVATSQSLEMVFLGVVFCVFVVIRHMVNIKRLLSGTESRIKTPFCRKS